jgi:mannose PTS system EIID component
MVAIGRRAVWSMLLRSFTIQGSWNYRTLVGTGFAFALLPVLRTVYGADPDGLRAALGRHASLFNSHPYLAGIALGGVARLEAEGATADVIERFKNALRGSLGTFGDRLVWAGWRPICIMLALLVFLAGAPWWAAGTVFLIIYNIGHVTLRVWALRLGLRCGLRVGERLRQSSISRLQQLMPGTGAFLLGALVPLAATGEFVGMRPALLWVMAALGATAIGVRLGSAMRTPLALLLALVAVAGVIAGSRT